MKNIFESDYRTKCLNKVTMEKYDMEDVTPEMFDKVLQQKFRSGILKLCQNLLLQFFLAHLVQCDLNLV